MNERKGFIRVAATVVAAFVISSMVSANSTMLTTLTGQSAATAARAAATVLPAVLGSLTHASAMTIQDQPPPAEPSQPAKPDTSTTTKTETTVWYVNPVWIALIVVGAIALILMIALAVRGGKSDTTIIRS